MDFNNKKNKKNPKLFFILNIFKSKCFEKKRLFKKFPKKNTIKNVFVLLYPIFLRNNQNF